MTRRRTFADVRVEEIVAERAGVLALRRAREAQIDAMVRREKLSPEDATVAKAQLRAFADMIATGLHREDADPVGVRARMRAIVREEAR